MMFSLLCGEQAALFAYSDLNGAVAGTHYVKAGSHIQGAAAVAGGNVDSGSGIYLGGYILRSIYYDRAPGDGDGCAVPVCDFAYGGG